jgi:S1-C subfamily serine protease
LSVFCSLSSVFCLLSSAYADDVDRRVLDTEARRVALIERIKPAVVAIFSANGQGGGSGVLITKDGYALTNFHVVQGSGPVMQCGLPDGVLYDAVLVGLDRVGDVALIKLLPKDKKQEFPAAVMGDSDKVKTGDWSLALGNPFLLATDFQPTVTFGLVSGTHRYQYPAGTLLEYTDCIQIDTSINPGNSGGPLFTWTASWSASTAAGHLKSAAASTRAPAMPSRSTRSRISSATCARASTLITRRSAPLFAATPRRMAATSSWSMP